MPEYYFDIETVPLESFRGEEKAGTVPSKAKIVTIQYQQLHSVTGKPVGDLQILKEWEIGEQEMVEQFKKIYLDKGVWNFIPVGNNLAFESQFMKSKLKQYCNLEGLRLGHRPMIDLKHVLVIANGGRFDGYSRFLGKSGLAKNMESWYFDGNYDNILNYVKKEAEDFVKGYCILKKELPRVITVQS
ncbi:hypothetical protein NTE_01145 [Candidatus Nitrososphaera evergladensis SR1]|uniref:Uncharacterized protein n=1 Tax=Candidatus Nitrososphaera evergladensis SR1 TaxID=1459636 RepID=A0A075MMK2_9ARCH|nr:hypothetical protein [Candidatus Nitrososphaera evergladensis]AIF82365.1 hypothetical protein NTE_00283 [Candidatus Nitrososphaera evergladensis SR1]AIF83218.1 hypothetical protein NTE_01145 [Candidatus Nitrososphaera evergladensis SR1]